MHLTIDRVVVRVINLPLKEPFRTGLGTVAARNVVIVEVIGEGLSGFGECAVIPLPDYSIETPASAVRALTSNAAPLLFKNRPSSPADLGAQLAQFNDDPIGCAGLEMACWDWWAKAHGAPLWRVLGGARSEITVGVSVPLFDDTSELLDRIARYLAEGYERIKIKMTPGREAVCGDILARFGSIPLMVDANGAYTPGDIAPLRTLDEYGLLMIEQPFAAPNLAAHAEAQRWMKTPVCLDESIVDVDSARRAIDLGACRIITVKPGRVGGLTAARAIHDLGAARGVGVWCGGLLETGIGRAHNIALATLPNFSYPGDISASTRYFERDIIFPEVTVHRGGKVAASEKPGIGHAVDRVELERITEAAFEIQP